MKNLNNRTKESVFKILFDRIVNGDYKTGFRLTEQTIAQEFNMSRTPIREVLSQLASLRLVNLTPNKGAEVVGITCDDVDEMYEIRMALEILALDTAMQNFKLQELSNLKNKVKSIGINSDLSQLAKIDHEIHSYIVDCSNKPRLKAYAEQLFVLTIRNSSFPFPKIERIDQICDEHIEILNALFQRNKVIAREALYKHINNSKIAALDFMFTKKID